MRLNFLERRSIHPNISESRRIKTELEITLTLLCYDHLPLPSHSPFSTLLTTLRKFTKLLESSQMHATFLSVFYKK